MEIAIVGAGCRLPGGVSGLEEFWKMLVEGRDCITEIPADRWSIEHHYDPVQQTPGKTYAKHGGFVENTMDFDPQMFGISPREATSLDPQQRMLLEVTYETLEDAGMSLADLEGTRTGVYVGLMNNDYKITVMHGMPQLNAYTSTGAAVTLAANRLSYFLHALGPSMVIDTACSSSLIAVHLGCESIIRGECEMALCGGVNYNLHPGQFVDLSKIGMLSPDGRCKAFDSRGNGYVRSEGTGLVLLKPLHRALADKDHIHAIIRGTAANSDGRSSVPVTAPNRDSHERMLRAAYARAQVDPTLVQYVEAHGTGTKRGDPVEAGALGAVLGVGRARGDYCVIGSVKSNLGHMESAAGVTGLIKSCLILKHQQIPQNLHFLNPNPDIDFEALHLRVPVALEDLPARKGTSPHYVGVNSFGYGGTNAHVVLEEPAPLPHQLTAPESALAISPPHVLVLSAHNKPTLDALANRFVDFLRDKDDLLLRNVCFTAASRRTHHAHRVVVLGENAQALCSKLDGFLSNSSKNNFVYDKAEVRAPPPVVFVFSGQGPQWWGMGKELLQHPVFREVFDKVDRLLFKHTGWSVMEQLQKSKDDPAILENTYISQPSMFALQVSLVALWRHWGITPSAVIGHSIGEIAGAYACGAITLEQGVQIVYHRSSLQQRLANTGKMLAVGMSYAECQAFLAAHGMSPAQVSVAAVNSPAACTLAGAPESVEEVQAKLEAAGTFNRMLRVNIAFHSPLTEQIKEDFLRLQQETSNAEPQVPFFSTVTGEVYQGKFMPQYWWNNVREPVFFNQGLSNLISHFSNLDKLGESNKYVFLEIGPHPVLSAYTKEILGTFPNFTAQVLPSLRRDQSEFGTIFASLAHLHAAGVLVDWKRFHSNTSPPPSMTALPLYPWQRQRYWLESDFSYRLRMGLSQPTSHHQGTHPLLPSPHTTHDDLVFTWSVGLTTDQQPQTTTITTSSLPFLADHIVHGVVLMPGVAFVEMARQACTQLLETKMERALAKTSAVAVKNVRFLRALALEAGAVAQARVRVDTGQSSEQWHFEIVSDSADDVNPYVTGQLSLRTSLSKNDLPETLRTDFIKSEGVTVKDGEAIYEDLAKKGLAYGPSFRLLRRAWQNNGHALSELVVTPAVQEALQQYAVHPCLFDCALHGMIAALKAGSRGGLIPVGMDRIFFHAKPNPEKNTFWVKASVSQDKGSEVTGDIALYNDDGQAIVEIFGFHIRFLDATQDRDISDCIITSSWEPQPIPADAENKANLHPRSDYYDWVIFDDGETGAGIGKHLLELFPGKGEINLTWVTPGPSFEHPSEDKYVIDPEDADSFVRVLEPILTKNKPVMILYLWALRVAPLQGKVEPNELRSSQVLSFGGALHLSQAAWRLRPDAQSSEPILFWFVTRGAQEVAGARAEHPLQAPLWGAARCLMLESDGVFECFTCDLDPKIARDQSAALWKELSFVSASLGDVPNDFEIAYRGDVRFANRLQREKVTLPSFEGSETIVLKENTYPTPEFGPWALDTAHVGSVSQWVFKKITIGGKAPEFTGFKPEACGINFKDVLIAAGRLERETSYMLGLEAAGTVVIPPQDNEQNFKVGDQVMGLVTEGLASYCAGLVVRKPPSWTMEEAAAVPVVFTTVYYALQYLARLQAGQRVLIHSATGGVGMAAIWFANRVGAEIFATAGSEERREALRAMGIKHVMDSRTLEFADTILEITNGKGVDVVLHGGARSLTHRSLEIVSDGGYFIDLGKASEMEKLQGYQLNPKANVSICTVELQHLAYKQPKLVLQLLAEVVGLLEGDGVPLSQVLPIRTVPLHEIADAFRQMQTAQHRGKIVVRTAAPSAADSVQEHREGFSEVASYLVVGGVRGFGLAVAEWMSVCGAKSIILVSRSGAAGIDEQGRSVVASMEARGTRVSVFSVDVSNWERLEEFVREIEKAGLPPLRGVIQSSVVLEDCLAVQNSLPKYFRVSDPKVVGTWNLHCATKHLPLDFFVMFSSVASLLGNVAQSSYAAANLFMDSFASYRRSLGLAGTSVNWGVIAEVGVAARNVDHLSDMFGAQGLFTVRPAEAFRALHHLLFPRTGSAELPAQVGVIRADFAQWAEAYPSYDTFPRYSALIEEDRGRRAQTPSKATAAAGSDALNFFRLIESFPSNERPAQVSQYISAALARILQVEASEIGLNEKLLSFGVDSLMSSELRSVLLRELQLDVPVVYLLQQATVSSLVGKALVQVELHAAKTAQNGIAPAEAATQNGTAPAETATKESKPNPPPKPSPAVVEKKEPTTPTPAAPQPTPAAPQTTPAAPQPTPAAPQPTPAAPQPTPAAPQPTPAAPQARVEFRQPVEIPIAALPKEKTPEAKSEPLPKEANGHPTLVPNGVTKAPNGPPVTHTKKAPKLRKVPPFPMGSLHEAYWLGRKGIFGKKGVSCHFYFQFAAHWDLPRLQSSLLVAIARHACMRTIVLPEGLFKILDNVPPYVIEVQDLSGLPESEAHEEVEKTRERMSHQEFVTDKWPLFEIRVSKISANKHVLHIDFDHIILDLKGGLQFKSEWGAYYQNPNLMMPVPETSMYNYLLGLQSYRQSSPEYKAAWAYWKDKAPTLPNSPPLPIATELGLIDGPKFSRRVHHFSPEVGQAISRVAKIIGVTPSILILTAFSKVLSVWSNATHFTLTVVAFNRLDVCADVDRILGDFTSTILMAIDASDEKLSDMAHKIQQKLHTDLQHVQVSGVDILREMAKGSGRSGMQAFPVVFTSVLDRDSGSLDWLGEMQTALSETPQVYMDCIAYMAQGNYHLSLDVVEEVFLPGFVSVFFSALERLLGALHEEGGYDIWTTPGASHTLLIPPSERALRTQVNTTKTPFPHVTLHQLFLQQVTLNPAAPALVDFIGNTWTYKQLFEHAWLTYNRLKENGVKSGDLVAVLAKKGWEQVVSVLAILFCGAAYLPVDISFPSARISELLSLGKVQHCLIPADLASEFAAAHPLITTVSVVTLDEYIKNKIFPSPSDIPSGDPSQLAYVLFTSGSTGVPKGVMIEHAGAVNTVSFVVKKFGVGAKDTLVFLNALHFDLSVFDLFGALGSGARLAIPRAEQVRDPVAISRLILKHNITIWNSVPQMLNLLLEHLHQSKSTVPNLRLVMLSGDVVRSDMPPNVERRLPNALFVALGGPTEITIWSNYYVVEKGTDTSKWATVPYGFPIDNMSLYVLDANLRPCPVWVVGEICIGGVGVARGYAGAEKLTQQRFVMYNTDEQGQDGSVRVHTSGDMGRYLPDGSIEIVGRRDLQVKVQGYRIDILEIEKVLILAGHAKNCAVVTVKSEEQQHLIAFIVPSSYKDIKNFKYERHGIRPIPDSAQILPLAHPEFSAPLRERRTCRFFNQQKLTREQLTQFLRSTAQAYQPLLAGLHVLCYVHLDKFDDMPAGGYLFNQKTLLLEEVGSDLKFRPEDHAPHNQRVFQDAHFSLFFFAPIESTSQHVGQLLTQTGRLGYKLMVEANAHSLGLCPIGGMNFANIHTFLAPKFGNLKILHTMIGGLRSTLPDPEPTANAPTLPSTMQFLPDDGKLTNNMKEFLKTKLPPYMVPSRFALVNHLPVTLNGKLDRTVISQIAKTNFSGKEVNDTQPQTAQKQETDAEPSPSSPDVDTSDGDNPKVARRDAERELLALVRGLLPRTELTKKMGPDDNFFSLGATSLTIVQLYGKVQPIYPIFATTSVITLFDYPTVNMLLKLLEKLLGYPLVVPSQNRTTEVPAQISLKTDSTSKDIAVIGYSCRFPGAPTIDKYWELLQAGAEPVTFFTKEQLLNAGVPEAIVNNPNYVAASAILEHPNQFDADFFGIAPKEAALMDPQHRVFMLCASEALERAGYLGNDPKKKSVGVWASASFNTYLINNLLPGTDIFSSPSNYMQYLVTNDKDYLASRVAYHLNLHGPAVAVQSACSSSLLAVTQACNALNARDCSVAIAGGASVIYPEVSGYMHEEGNIFSKDGHCRVFDTEATGIIRGNGAGVVVLKRLDDAIRDRDNIHCVIKGWGTNNDGFDKSGFTAPSANSQAAVMVEALHRANIEPESIGYVEAHGTATRVGDSIEAQSLKQVFSPATSPPSTPFIAVGSVKSNIGHLDVACGIAGLLKTILAIEHKQIPPSLHYHTPNPDARFEDAGSLYVNAKLRSWEKEEGSGARRAAVNSFGIGGTNVAMVVEEYTALPTKRPENDSDTNKENQSHLLVLSAKTETALQEACSNLLVFLRHSIEQKLTLSLTDVAYTLQTTRREFPYRATLIARDQIGDAVTGLEKLTANVGPTWPKTPTRAPQVVLLFPGQNTEFFGMARGFYHAFPEFRADLDNCLNHLPQSEYGDLRARVARVLLAEPGEFGKEEKIPTNVAQPSLFVFQYCTARVLMKWGINPYAMIGHSLGEYTAACIAGVFSIEDAIRLVCARGEILHSLAGTGAMLVVQADEQEAKGLATDDVCIASVNAPQQTVLSGPRASLEKIQQQLNQKGTKTRLMGEYPFHHTSIGTKSLIEELNSVRFGKPTIPYLSNLSGSWITNDEATTPQYWADHMTHGVRFMENVNEVTKKLELEGDEVAPVWVEVGPGSVLSALVGRIAPQAPVTTCLPKIPENETTSSKSFLQAIGFLWAKGIPVEWKQAGGQEEGPRVVELPTYPFQYREYCVVPKHKRVHGVQEPDFENFEKKAAFNPLRDADSVKKTLSTLWNDVIGHTGDSDASWFEVGGDSLNCVQLVGRIGDVFGIMLSVPSIFAHPTIASQCDLLLESGLTVAATNQGPTSAVVREEEEFPASLQQESLYFVELLDPMGAAYLVHFAGEISGDIDKERFEASFAAVVHRHAQTLACRFVMRDEMLMARVSADAAPFRLQAYHDWADLPDKEDKLKRYMQEEAVRGFDVRSPSEPLLRVYLIRTAPTTHVVFVVVHHLIVDGWSLGVILKDLTHAYQTTPAQLPTLSLTPLEPTKTYAQFARWQRERMSKDSPVRVKLAAFWKERLRDAKPLPMGDFPRPAAPSTKGARVPIVLPVSLANGLARVAREAKTTLFGVVMAAFQVLLYLYTGQEDICVGAASANRLRSEWEDIVGLFTNMVVVRTPNMDSLSTFPSVLEQVSKNILQALEHQEMPFHVVVEEVNPPRDPSIHPLFQAALVLHNEHASTPAPPGTLLPLSVAPRSLWTTETNSTIFDLNLQLWPDKNTPGSLSGYMEYSTEIFREDTVVRMVDNLVSLFGSVASDWKRDVAAMSYISHEEIQQITVKFNSTAAPYPADKCVHELFEERARGHPHAPAIIWEGDGQTWTFEKLNRSANLVAKHLLSQGVVGNARVGLVFDRSIHVIVCMLAAWKAGAAYVPINPEATKVQFLHVLNDAQINVLLVHSTTEPTVRSWLEDKRVIVINADHLLAHEPTSSDDVAPSVRASPSELAYIIYTSGSTGAPKGVCIEHRSVTNIIHFLTYKSWNVTESDRVLLVARYFFDFSVAEIFVPLSRGATLVLASQAVLMPGPLFVSMLQRLAVSVMLIMPSALNSLDDATSHPSKNLPHLRLVLVGGEPVTYNTVRVWVTPSRPMINSYGPTESTVISNTWRVDFEDLARIPAGSNIGLPPIGVPISNAQSLILHPQTLQLVPIGAVGELFLGGVGTARGYTNPEITAQRFLRVRDLPGAAGNELRALYRDAEDARLYRTGDLARWLPDGNVQCLGRVDSQVKLRGYRIELEEIQSVLNSHPLVANAVVVMHSPVPSDPSANQLVAFVEREGQQPGGVVYDDNGVISLLKAHVAQILPIYMHPYMYIIGPLPRGATGKIDKKALVVTSPVSFLNRTTTPTTSNPPVPPTGRTEVDLLTTFCAVLHLEGREKEVGVSAGFFDLGGNSLLAARLLTRVHAQFGQVLPLATLFSHPTVRQLASVLAQPPPTPALLPTTLLQKYSTLEQKSPLLLIQAGDGTGKPTLFCVHPAGGNAMCFYALAAEIGGYPVYALEDPNSGDPEAYAYTTVHDMAEAYISAIKTVQPEGPYFLLGFSLGGVVAHTIGAILEKKGEKVALVVAIDGQIRSKETDNQMEDVRITELLIDRLERAATPDGESPHAGGTPPSQATSLATTQGPVSLEAQWKKVDVLLSRLFQQPSADQPNPSPSSSPFAARFVFLFRKHLALIAAHAVPVFTGGTVVLMCPTDRAAAAAIEQEWHDACRSKVEFLSLPPSYTHTTIMYQPYIKYLALLIRARVDVAALG